MTILEAKVNEKYWQLLQETYENMTKEVLPIIKGTYLIQNQTDRSMWRIVTMWESQEALNAMRNLGETPVGVVIFQKTHATPALEIYDIKKHVAL